MITRWAPRLVHWLTIAAVTTACGTTNPTDVDFTGDWVATIDADGIGEVRLGLVESTSSFYLVFPAGNNPVRVQFQRR